MFSKYASLIEKRPILTKCCTAFFTVSAGDILCQTLEHIRSPCEWKYDFIRTAKFASFAFMFTPFAHTHYSVIMPKIFPSPDKSTLVKSVIFDQTVYTPVYFLAYFAYMNCISGKSFDDLSCQLSIKYFESLRANWIFWPLIMLGGFIYVPVMYRVLYINVFGIFWNTYFSYMQNAKVMIKK